MKASEIVAQLAERLPRFTDKFTTNLNVTSLTRVGFTVTVVTDSEHNLKVGKQINIVGAESPIDILTLTRAGEVGTLTTDTDHDIIKFSLAPQTLDISGSNEPEFNGSFVLLSQPNRRKLIFKMVDTGAIVATGSPKLLNGSSIYQGYNGLFPVAGIIDSTSFTYIISTLPPLAIATGNITARTLPRISSGVSVERLLASYTKTPLDQVWAFVILGDVIASKNRAIDSDGVDNQQRGNEYRQQIVQPFSILTLVPTTSELAARGARDLAEELFRPICQSLLFSKFDSGLYVGAQNTVVFSDHGFAFYDTTKYGHTYAFQTTSDLTFDDTVGYDADVAFRDIQLDMDTDVGTELDPLTADINLDDTTV